MLKKLLVIFSFFVFAFTQILQTSYGLTPSSYNCRSYVLGPDDVLSIYVYDNSDFDQENVRIQPDGNVVLSPLGTINISGLKMDEFEKLLMENYKYYLNDPKLTIKLEEKRPFFVYITGGVQNPGSYELVTNAQANQSTSSDRPEVQIDRKTPMLSNVLVASGGITHDADLENIVITNKYTKESINVNLMTMLNDGDSDQDVYLMPGDNIYVPRLITPFAVDENKYKLYAKATFSPKNIPVRVFGYVSRPGLIRLDSADSLTLNSAITAAGGYQFDTAYASKKVYISRADANGKLVTKAVNPMSKDVVLMPNDIIYVPHGARPVVGRFFDYLTRIFTPANTFASTYNNWALMFEPTRYQVIGK